MSGEVKFPPGHVPTEAESAALDLRLSETMKELEVTALRVKAERDELLKALRWMLVIHGDEGEASAFSRVVLAKIKGKT